MRFQTLGVWKPVTIARVLLANTKLVGMPRCRQFVIQYIKLEAPMLRPIRRDFQVKGRWCGLWSGRGLDPR